MSAAGADGGGSGRSTGRDGSHGAAGAPGRRHAPPGEAEDRYRTFIASRTYRRQRPEKARVIARICGDEMRAARRIGDLGTGTGIVKNELETITGKYIVGFELDRSFMEIEERMVVADVTRLPVADGGLDFAVLNHLYEHVEDQPALFAEVHRALAPGGIAYVSAGSRWALVEPHYRLPFLSWLPRGLADLYLRITGRGEAYRGIRFLGYGRLTGMMRRSGFRVEDRTRRAIDELLDDTWGPGWGRLWRAVRSLPEGIVGGLLRVLSPQWFFLLHKPRGPGDAAGRPGPGTAPGAGGP